MNWHPYPKDKPEKTGVPFLVHFLDSSGLRHYAVDRWFGDTWYCVNNVTHWVEIEKPKEVSGNG